MPYTRRQLERIMRDDLIPEGRMPYAGRVAESYIKHMLFVHEDRVVQEQWGMFQATTRDLREIANRITGGGKPDTTFKRPFMEAATARLSALYRDIERTAGQGAVQAYYAGYLGRLWLLDNITNERAPLNKRVPPLALGMKQALLAEQGGLENVPWDDVLWELLGRQWRSAYELERVDVLLRIQRGLNTGIREGQGVSDLMRRVSEALGVQIDRRRGAVGSIERLGYRANFNRVQAITRTYTMSASNVGAMDVYNENADVLDGSEHLTARDERVCAQCRDLDGTIYPLETEWYDLPPNNAHPLCRCTVIPIVKNDLVSDLANEQPLTSFYEPPAQTFSDWAAFEGVTSLLAGFLVNRLVSTERV